MKGDNVTVGRAFGTGSSSLKLRRTAATGVLGVLGGAAVLAAPAFACSDNAAITVARAPADGTERDPAASPAGGPGSDVTVTGRQFLDPETGAPPVEIRWASDTGPVLVSVAGPSFATRVTVPASAAPGFYYVVAVQRNKSSELAWKRVATFEVTAPAVPDQPPVVPGSAGPGPAPATPGPAPATPGPAPATPGQAPATPAPAPSKAGALPLAPARSVAPLVPAASIGRSGAAAPAAGVTGPAPVASPAPPLGGSVPSAGAGATPTGVSDQAPIPATNDLWSGLAPGGAPSLLDPAASSGAGHGAGLPVGAGLLGVGLAALAGTAALTAKRRLALARRAGTPRT